MTETARSGIVLERAQLGEALLHDSYATNAT